MVSGKSKEWYEKNCDKCPYACLVDSYRDADGHVYQELDCCNECDDDGDPENEKITVTHCKDCEYWADAEDWKKHYWKNSEAHVCKLEGWTCGGNSYCLNGKQKGETK